MLLPTLNLLLYKELSHFLIAIVMRTSCLQQFMFSLFTYFAKYVVKKDQAAKMNSKRLCYHIYSKVVLGINAVPWNILLQTVCYFESEPL